MFFFSLSACLEMLCGEGRVRTRGEERGEEMGTIE